MKRLMRNLLLAGLLLNALLLGGCARGGDAPVTMDAEPLLFVHEDAKNGSETSEPARFSNVVITVRKDAQIVTRRAVTEPEEIEAVQEIVFDHMVKSAAWEGIEADKREDSILLSFDWTADSARQNYYQYDTQGKHVLQAGANGMYTVMSDGAYEKLMRLAGFADADG